MIRKLPNKVICDGVLFCKKDDCYGHRSPHDQHMGVLSTDVHIVRLIY